jgi:heme-degrading monooxygenase HmoA
LFTLQLAPDKVDEFIRLWHDVMVPTARSQKGWKGARLLMDRKTSKAIVVGDWETEADATSTSTGSGYADQQRATLAGLITAPPMVEHYELVGQAS